MVIEKQLADTDSLYCVRATNSHQTSIFIGNIGDNKLDAIFGQNYQSDDIVRLRLNKKNLAFNCVSHHVDGHAWFKRSSNDKWVIDESWLFERLKALNIAFNSASAVFFASLNKDENSTHRLYLKGMADLKREDGGSSIALRDFLFSGDIIELSRNENNEVEFEIKIPNNPIIPYEITDSPSLPQSENLQLIIHGAPGTGKSHQLNEKRKNYFDDAHCERVTFYPNYSYAQFVGTYKPIMTDNKLDVKNKEIISILSDKNKTAQEKYDELFERFRDDNNLTRLPMLLGFYCEDGVSDLKTKKSDGTPTADDNSVAVNSGIALRNFIQPLLQCEQEITYKYVPGPFMRTYVKAIKNPSEDFLLIIEELNRANAAAVFGDLFQLLDRLEDGTSEYPVAASEDLRQFLADEGVAENTVVSLPSNMYIWTTMNSADQGVFPLDTAFKRRWDNIYIGINEKQSVIEKCNFHFADGFYNWNEFRKEINSLLTSCRVNEDKLIGPFFLNPLGLSDEQFADKFKSKVLMYLYEDAARQCRGSVFAEDDNKKQRTYSDLCVAFDKMGAGIFKGIELTIVSHEEDASLNVEQKTDLQNFVEYLKEKKNLGESSRRGYGSWVRAVLKLLKEKNIPLDTAIKDNAIVFSAISDMYPNEGTRTNYCTGWRSFVEFKNNDSTGTKE